MSNRTMRVQRLVELARESAGITLAETTALLSLIDAGDEDPLSIEEKQDLSQLFQEIDAEAVRSPDRSYKIFDRLLETLATMAQEGYSSRKDIPGETNG